MDTQMTLQQALNRLTRIENDFLMQAETARERRKHLTRIMDFLTVDSQSEDPPAGGKLNEEMLEHTRAPPQGRRPSGLRTGSDSLKDGAEDARPSTAYEIATQQRGDSEEERESHIRERLDSRLGEHIRRLNQMAENEAARSAAGRDDPREEENDPEDAGTRSNRACRTKEGTTPGMDAHPNREAAPPGEHPELARQKAYMEGIALAYGEPHPRLPEGCSIDELIHELGVQPVMEILGVNEQQLGKLQAGMTEWSDDLMERFIRCSRLTREIARNPPDEMMGSPWLGRPDSTASRQAGPRHGPMEQPRENTREKPPGSMIDRARMIYERLIRRGAAARTTGPLDREPDRYQNLHREFPGGLEMGKPFRAVPFTEEEGNIIREIAKNEAGTGDSPPGYEKAAGAEDADGGPARQEETGAAPTKLADIRPDFRGAVTLRDNLERIGAASHQMTLVPGEIADLLIRWELSRSKAGDLRYRICRTMRENPGLYRNNGDNTFQYNPKGRRAV